MIFVYLHRRVVATTKNIISKSLYDKDYDPLIRAFLIMKIAENRIGEKHTTNEGYSVKITEYFNALNCTIEFETGIILKNIRHGNLKRGNVKNPYSPSVYGVGYFGEGIYDAWSGEKHTKEYKTWMGMMERCYSNLSKEKHPAYKDCLVDADWHNFQNFAKWFKNEYNPKKMNGWHLDKDILTKSNRVYSAKNCCFVPYEINSLFVKGIKRRGVFPIGVSYSASAKKYTSQINENGNRKWLGNYNTPEEAFHVYKKAKELKIKEIANKWRKEIDKKVYRAMINYKVEITD